MDWLVRNKAMLGLNYKGLLFAGAVILAGCGQTGTLLQKDYPLTCPPSDVVEQASSFSDFGAATVGDVNSLQYNVRFVGLSGKCSLDKKAHLTLDLYMLFMAQAGVGLEKPSLTTDAPWYVTVLRKDAIVARQEFALNVALVRDGDLVPVKEHFIIEIPNQTDADVAEYHIISGFLLDDVQWDFNEKNPFYFR